MRPLRSALFLAAFAIAVAPVAAPIDAAAQTAPAALPASGLVEFAPVGTVIGDGETLTGMHLVAIGADGRPIVGLRGKVTASEGSVSSLADLGGGVYAFNFEAPDVTLPRDVTLTFKGKTPSRLPVVQAVTVPVQPRDATKLGVAAMPLQLIAGKDASASLSIGLIGAPGQEAGATSLSTRVSQGTLQNITPGDGGSFSARFAARGVNFPHLSLIAVADKADPLGAYGHAVVALSGSVEFPVSAVAGSSVSLQIAGETFGPTVAGADGRALVPVVVPPGVSTAKATVITAGNTNQSDIDLGLPVTPRLLMMPTPAGVPGDGSTSYPIRTLVVTPAGAPDPAAKLTLKASAGTVSAATHMGNGIYEARYVPPRTDKPTLVTLDATLAGEGDQADTLTLTVVPAVPASVTLTSSPAALARGGTDLIVTAAVKDAAGAALSGVPVSIVGGGAELLGAIEDPGDGTRIARFRTKPTGPVEVLATPLPESAGNPLAHVLVLPARDRLANDGVSGTPVVVLALDAYGGAVSGVSVSLEVGGTDGTITPVVTTNDHGIGLALYTSGSTAGLSRLRGASGDIAGAAAVMQVPASVAAVKLPPSGSEDVRALASAWQKRVVLLRVQRSTGDTTLWGTEPEPVATAEPEPTAEPDPAVEPEPAVAVAPEPEPTPEPDPVAPAPVAPPVTPVRPAPASEHAWLRARASYVFSTYRYAQEPIADGGILIDDVLAVGGELGAGPATPMGFEVAGRAWLPMFEYVGFDVDYRATYYGITTDAFQGQIVPDTLYVADVEALGRYPFDVDTSRFHVGARLGLHVDDFLYFTGDVDDGQVFYQTLAVPSLTLGAEIGAEVGDASAVVGVERGWAYARNGYATRVDAHVSYDILPNAFVDVGFGAATRRMIMVGADTGTEFGEISDGQFLFQAGVGFKM